MIKGLDTIGYLIRYSLTVSAILSLSYNPYHMMIYGDPPEYVDLDRRRGRKETERKIAMDLQRIVMNSRNSIRGDVIMPFPLMAKNPLDEWKFITKSRFGSPKIDILKIVA